MYTPAELLQLKRNQELREARRATNEREKQLESCLKSRRELAEAARLAVRAIPQYEPPSDLFSHEVLDVTALKGLEGWLTEREARATGLSRRIEELRAQVENLRQEAQRRRTEAEACRVAATELRREPSFLERPFASDRAERVLEARKRERQASAKDANAVVFDRQAEPLQREREDLSRVHGALTAAVSAGRTAVGAVRSVHDANKHVVGLRMSPVPTTEEEVAARHEAQDARELERTTRQASRAEALRAKAAAYDNRIREDADAVRRVLPRDHPCPLCGNALGDNPHADHIHPVSQGGLSIKTNLVYVCEACNLSKGMASVFEFALRTSRDFHAIAERLRSLGKRV